MLARRLCLVALLIGSFTALGADWPTCNADANRSAVTTEKLAFPLKAAWVYAPAQPPRPAWPEPGKEMHRMAFDYAPQPVIVGGRVYVGSSADDTVRALDAGTGKVMWRFTTGGPVRFAPTVADGKLYVASDDGYLYCLHAKTGDELWKFRAAPADDQLLGNGRMISRWPLRAGVLVDGGVAYVAAGMWPNEGIRIYALNAETRQVVWCNDTSDDMYIATPHGGASAFTGPTPQGYLLATEDTLLVPTGRSVPAAYDRRTGKLRFYSPSGSQFDGGSWATVVGDIYLNPGKHRFRGGRDARIGELDPMKTEGLLAFGLADGRRVAELVGKHRAVVSEGVMYATGTGHVHAIDLKAWRGGAKLEKAAKWETPHGRAYCLALARNALVVGGRGTVTAFDPGAGQQIWQAKVDGQVRGLAIAGGQLVATTNKGAVIAFQKLPATATARNVVEKLTWQDASSPDAARVQEIIKRSGKTEGYALVVSPADSRMAEALAGKTRLHVVSLLIDSTKVAAERRRLLAGSPYGSRIVVQGLKRPDRLPYASYFADLVVVVGNPGDLSGKEVYRVLRPYGGVLCFSGTKPATIDRLLSEAGIPKAERRTPTSVVRGKLPGAGQWRHQWADGGRSGIGTESRLRLPLELLWFGGPGPDRMMDRHSGTSPPLFAGGRVFITGRHHVIAFDAYNGRELWSREVKHVGRSRVRTGAANICADGEAVYVAVGAECHRLDAATGRTLKTYKVPKFATHLPPGVKKWGGRRWGYLAVTDDLVLGSIYETRSSEESTAVFALVKTDGSTRWAYPAIRQVDNTGIAFGEGKVFLLDVTFRGSTYSAKRRGYDVHATGELVALDLAKGTPAWKQPDVPLVHRYLQVADGVVVVDADAGYEAATGRKLWRRSPDEQAFQAKWTDRLPIIYDKWIIVQPMAYDLRTGRRRTTTDILTGRKRPWKFTRAYGCNDVVGCRGLLTFRSGMEGLYDFAQDGTTTYAGVKPACGVSTIPAGGLMIHAEGSSGCTCSYNFQTSLALAPGRARHDLWYVFQGEPADAPVQHVSVNLGAPGDRRDGQGIPWLGFPREYARRVVPGTCPIPLSVGIGKGSWYYRPSSALAVTGTKRPWLYASGLRGSGRLVFDLVLSKSVVIPRVERGPKIDAALDDPCWKGAQPLRFAYNRHLQNPRTTVFVCRDAKNMYFAYRRDAVVKDGKPLPFRADQTGRDAKVWLDDSFELQLTDKRLLGCVQLAVSCSGARIARRNLLDRGNFLDPMKWRTQVVVDPEWQGRWTSKVNKGTDQWTAEVAVPLKTLAGADIDVDSLQLNIISRMLGGRSPYIYMSWFVSRDFKLPVLARPLRTIIESPVVAPKRRMTVKLHFAEPDDLKPGQRVFDVAIQGKKVLKNFDIVKEAGAPRRAVVKEFSGISAAKTLTVELSPTKSDSGLQPVLCAIQVRAD